MLYPGPCSTLVILPLCRTYPDCDLNLLLLVLSLSVDVYSSVHRAPPFSTFPDFSIKPQRGAAPVRL